VKENPILLDITHQGRSVFLSLSDERVFELAPDSLPVSLPAVGGMLSSPLLIELQDAAQRKLATREVFRLLDRRLYPSSILKNKLSEKGFEPRIADAVLSQFEAQGVHSDFQYAIAFCRDTIRRGPRGKQYLRSRLFEQRVSRDCIERAIEQELSDELEAELASKAAARRWQRFPGQSADFATVAKVVRFLVGRGFPVGLAKKAARATGADHLDVNDEEF